MKAYNMPTDTDDLSDDDPEIIDAHNNHGQGEL
jgi:hypothetical protein